MSAPTESMVIVAGRVPEALRAELEAIAKEHDRSLGAEIRRACREYVANEKRRNKRKAA